MVMADSEGSILTPLYDIFSQYIDRGLETQNKTRRDTNAKAIWYGRFLKSLEKGLGKTIVRTGKSNRIRAIPLSAQEDALIILDAASERYGVPIVDRGDKSKLPEVTPAQLKRMKAAVQKYGLEEIDYIAHYANVVGEVAEEYFISGRLGKPRTEIPYLDIGNRIEKLYRCGKNLPDIVREIDLPLGVAEIYLDKSYAEGNSLLPLDEVREYAELVALEKNEETLDDLVDADDIVREGFVKMILVPRGVLKKSR